VIILEHFLAKKFLKLELAEWLLTFLIISYSIIFSYFLIMKFYSFRVGAWDMGILVQSIASTTKGQLFKYNVELYYCPTGNYFGVHFSPILFTVVPIFSLIPKVETIIVLHTVILSLGCVPIYLMVKNSLKNRLPALFLSAIYLLNPSLQGINWYDFVPQTFFPVLILSATYFLKKRKPALFMFFLILTLMTLEQSSYFVAIYTLYIAWELRKWIKTTQIRRKIWLFMPIATLAIAIFWIFLSSNVKNALNPNPPEELSATGNFKVLGVNNTAEIPIKVLTDPTSVFKALHYDLTKKIFYLLMTLAPTCFLCLASPIAMLPAIAWLLLALVSNWPPYYYIGFHYPAFTLPFVMIALIETLKKLSGYINGQKLDTFLTRSSLFLLCVNLILSIFASPLSPLQQSGDWTNFRDYGVTYPSRIDKTVMEVLNKLPSDSMILTTGIMFSHLATDDKAYTIPPLNVPSERLYKKTINYLFSLKYDYLVIVYYYWDKGDACRLYDNLVLGNSEYGLYIYAPGLEIYKRNYQGEFELLSVRFSYKELMTYGGIITDDVTSESGMVIKFKSSREWGNFAWYGPYICLLPGNYTAKFKIKVDSLPHDGKILKLEVWSNSLGRAIASYDVYPEDINKTLTWHTFTLQFNLPSRITDIEFRGLEVANNVTVWLDYVDIIPNTIQQS